MSQYSRRFAPSVFMENLDRYREEHGLSNIELAKLSGIPLHTLRSWERGSQPTRHSILKIDKLAKFFGTTLSELMYGS